MKKTIGITAVLTALILTVSTLAQPTQSLVIQGQTIQSAIDAAAVGDVVRVAAGNYPERLNINKAISVVCDLPHTCIIKGAVLNGNAVLKGFYSLNSDTNAGAIVANNSGNLIENNKIEGSCMVGINLYGSGNTAKGNEIFKSRQCPGSGDDADGIRYFGANQRMTGNFIHDITYGGVNIDPHIDCFQTWGGASNALIDNNICDLGMTVNAALNLAPSGANIENDVGATFRNNYIRTSGVMIMVESSSSGTRIENNIFVGAEVPNPPPHLYGIFGSGTGETAKNNTCWLCTTSNWLMNVTDGGGNWKEVDPMMSGYCATAPAQLDRGVLCAAPTSTPTATITPSLTASVTPTLTITPSITPSITPTHTRTPSPTPSPTATLTCFEDNMVYFCYRLK